MDYRKRDYFIINIGSDIDNEHYKFIKQCIRESKFSPISPNSDIYDYVYNKCNFSMGTHILSCYKENSELLKNMINEKCANITCLMQDCKYFQITKEILKQ